MKKENLPDFPDNGFVIVASMFEAFYKAAIELAESIKLFYPEAHITVFTSHEEWIKPTDWNHADWIVHWEVPNEIRAKLWALSQTPYKGKTVYFDADMVCESEEIENIFEIDENGILKVSAQCCVTGKNRDIILADRTGHMWQNLT